MTMTAALRPAPASDRPIMARRALRRACVALAIGAALAGCSGTPQRATFDLSAPADIGRVAPSRAQIVVNEPTALQSLDSDRIMVREGGAISYLPDSQYSDRLPRLFQVRLIQTFENASRIRSVARPGDRVVADLALNADLRTFALDGGTSQAVVEVTARLVSDRNGRVVAARAFAARVPVSSVTGASAVQGLDLAMSQVLRDIVRWASRP